MKAKEDALAKAELETLQSEFFTTVFINKAVM